MTDAPVDLKQLLTFQTVVRLGSFARAAEALEIAQSTVTLHVQALESQFGALLFTRLGRRAELTDAGRTLVDHATRVLHDAATLQDVMADFGSGATGHIRIGAIESAASIQLLPLLVQFMDERPNVQLRLEVGGTASICARVAGGELDVGLCSEPPLSPGLSFEPLFVEPFVLLLPECHPLAARPRLGIDDLDGIRLLVSEPGCQYRDQIEQTLLDHGASVYSGIEIGTIVGLKRAVQAGLGAAILPIAPVTPTPSGTVVRSIDGIEIGLQVGIVRRVEEGFSGRALADLVNLIRLEMHESALVLS